MSRTFRHIPYWAHNNPRPYEKTWIGLGDYHFTIDPRDKIINGYDNGKGQSYYYDHYPTRGWPEQYGKLTRKFVKRNFHKTRRLYDKRSMMKEMAEGSPSAEVVGNDDGTWDVQGL